MRSYHLPSHRVQLTSNQLTFNPGEGLKVTGTVTTVTGLVPVALFFSPEQRVPYPLRVLRHYHDLPLTCHMQQLAVERSRNTVALWLLGVARASPSRHGAKAMTREDEIFRMVYTGEEHDWDQAALAMAHQEQEEEYFRMNHAEPPSDIRVFGLEKSSIHARECRATVLKVSGYGYGQRPPSFSITENTVHLYLSTEEAQMISDKLLEFIKHRKKEEKAS